MTWIGVILALLVASGLLLALLVGDESAVSQPPEEFPRPAPGLVKLDLESEDELAEVVRRTGAEKDFYFRLSMKSGEGVAMGYREGQPWLDVFTRTRRRGEKGGVFSGPYQQFGYNALEGRWSYGEGPPGAREIRRLLADSFGAKETGRWS